MYRHRHELPDFCQPKTLFAAGNSDDNLLSRVIHCVHSRHQKPGIKLATLQMHLLIQPYTPHQYAAFMAPPAYSRFTLFFQEFSESHVLPFSSDFTGIFPTMILYDC